MKATPYIRAWVLKGFAELITQLGGDVDDYAARFQLPLHMAEARDAIVPGLQLLNMMEACAEERDCPDFGLRAGALQGRDALGPIALLAMQCADAGKAAAAITRYMNLLNSAIHMRLQVGRAGARLDYELRVPRVRSSRQFVEWNLAVGLKVLKLIAGPQARPRRIHLCHAPLLKPRFYADFFGCPVLFSQPSYGAEYFAADFARPILSTDPAVKAVVSDYMDRIAGSADVDLETQLRAMLRRMLPTGRCNLPLIAQHYFVSVRTMQRRLEAEGLIFETLLDQVRRECALQYLDAPLLRLSQVAAMLGYTKQSSFSHAFQRWYGQTPSAWRKAA